MALNTTPINMAPMLLYKFMKLCRGHKETDVLSKGAPGSIVAHLIVSQRGDVHSLFLGIIRTALGRG